MTSPAPEITDPLERAAAADRALWGGLTTTSRLEQLAVRNDAVREAVAAGRTCDEVAAALGVRGSDVDRMLFGS